MARTPDNDEDWERNNPMLVAVPPHLRPKSDSWSRFPLKCLAAAHAIGEALIPVLPKLAVSAASKPYVSRKNVNNMKKSSLQKPLSGVSIFYIVVTTIDRSRIASQFQILPERRTYAGNRMVIDNVLKESIANITIPSIIVGGAVNIMAGLVKARPSLPFGARLPWVIGLLSVPLAIPVSEQIAEATMNWAFRPFLNAYMHPSGKLPWNIQEVVAGPSPNYSAPNPEELLAKDEAAALLGLEMNALDKARLEWAMDGKADSPFPDGTGSFKTGKQAGAVTPFDKRSDESDLEYQARLDEIFARIHADAAAKVEASRRTAPLQ